LLAQEDEDARELDHVDLLRAELHRFAAERVDPELHVRGDGPRIQVAVCVDVTRIHVIVARDDRRVLVRELRRDRRAKRKREQQRRGAAKDHFGHWSSPVRSRDPITPSALGDRAAIRRGHRCQLQLERTATIPVGLASAWGCTMPIVKVTDLAYARLQSRSLDDAERFLTDFGMIKSERTRDALYMRGTDAPHHIHVTHRG